MNTKSLEYTWTCEICKCSFRIRSELYKHRKVTDCGKKQKELGYVKGAEKRKGQVGYWKGKHLPSSTKSKISKAAVEHSYWEHRKRNPIIYESKIAGKLNLDSFWEKIVAERLDKLNVVWWRPKIAIPYYDKEGVKRSYCPDFYVEDFHCFIEVKSKYILDRQNKNGKIDWLKSNYDFIIWLESEEDCKNFSLSIKTFSEKPEKLDECFEHIQKEKKVTQRQKLLEERRKLLNEANIDFSSLGWVTKVAKLFGDISPRNARKYIEKNFPEFSKETYKRKSPTI